MTTTDIAVIVYTAYGARRGSLISTEHSYLHDREVVVVRLDDGSTIRIFPMLVVPADVAESSWHVVDADGVVIAGGPSVTRERMIQFAERHPGSRVIRGIDPEPTESGEVAR